MAVVGVLVAVVAAAVFCWVWWNDRRRQRRWTALRDQLIEARGQIEALTSENNALRERLAGGRTVRRVL